MPDFTGTADRLDYLAAGWRPWVLLALLALALCLPGISALPPVDRDEARFIQATRQMLETSDFVRIRYQDEARNKKPVGIYWLQAAAVSAFSDAENTEVWPYRLVSVAGAVGAVLLTFLFGIRIFDRRTALIGAGLLASTLGLVFEAHIATTDATLLATAVAAQGALASLYLAHRRGEPAGLGMAALFWGAQGMAILVKGPVIPLISALTVAALAIADRRAGWLRALRPLWGVPLTLLIVLPWLIAIERATGGAFLREAVGHDLMGKVAGGQEAHGAWPGYYTLLLPVTFWPASLFLGAGAFWVWRSRRLAAARLLAAWVIPAWILFELVPTKLPHYVLPLYPALALACARGVIALGEEGLFLPRWVEWLCAGLWTLVGVAVGGALLAAAPVLGKPAMMLGAIPAAAVLAAGWQVMTRERRRLRASVVPIALMTALLVLVPGFQAILPRLDTLWLSRSAARLVVAERAPGAPVSATGYAEPSLVFLLGTNTRLLPAAMAARALAGGDVALSLVESRDDPAFRAALTGAGQVPRALGIVSGFDYSNGKELTLTLYRAEKSQ